MLWSSTKASTVGCGENEAFPPLSTRPRSSGRVARASSRGSGAPRRTASRWASRSTTSTWRRTATRSGCSRSGLPPRACPPPSTSSSPCRTTRAASREGESRGDEALLRWGETAERLFERGQVRRKEDGRDALTGSDLICQGRVFPYCYAGTTRRRGAARLTGSGTTSTIHPSIARTSRAVRAALPTCCSTGSRGRPPRCDLLLHLIWFHVVIKQKTTDMRFCLVIHTTRARQKLGLVG